jgi:hypothetical protein
MSMGILLLLPLISPLGFASLAVAPLYAVPVRRRFELEGPLSEEGEGGSLEVI